MRVCVRERERVKEQRPRPGWLSYIYRNLDTYLTAVAERGVWACATCTHACMQEGFIASKIIQSSHGVARSSVDLITSVV